MKKLIFILSILGLFSCKKDPKAVEPLAPIEIYVPPAPTTNSVVISITNMAGNFIIQVSKDTVYTSSTPKYINANTDTFSVTNFKYYISNIKLKKADGTYFVEPESYYLINAADTANTCKFAIKNVPYGKYVGIEYLIGVDSTRNCSGAQTGVLAATNDMFWSWNQGFIFLKFEGYSSAAMPGNVHNLEYHVGGFKLPYNNIKKVYLPLVSDTLRVGTNVPKIYFKTDIQHAFKNSVNNVNFATTQIVVSPSTARLIANNYANMMSIAAVVN